MPASFRRGPLPPQEFLTPKPGQPLGFYSVSVIDVATTTTVAATATGAWSGTANDGLQGFPQGQSVFADGPNTSFVPATATGDWQATADSGRQGFPQGQIVIGPALNGVDAIPTITTALPGIGRTGIGRLLRETEIFTGALPFEVPHHELPVAPEPLKVQIVESRIDNSVAFIALFESGALTEDEFVALLAA